MICIGKFRLRAFVSKFPDKKVSVSIAKRPAMVESVRPVVRAISSPSFRDTRSFKEVTIGTAAVDSDDPVFKGKDNTTCIYIPKNFTEEEWVHRSIVARVFDITTVLRMKRYPEEQQIHIENLALLGNNAILLTFSTIPLAEYFLVHNGSRLLDFFQSFSWVEDFHQAFSRLVWVSISGIPVSLWSPAVFIEIGNSIGESIMVHNSVHDKHRMDRGLVLISSTCYFINLPFQLQVGGKTVTLYVTETILHVAFDMWEYENSTFASGFIRNYTLKEDVVKSPLNLTSGNKEQDLEKSILPVLVSYEKEKLNSGMHNISIEELFNSNSLMGKPDYYETVEEREGLEQQQAMTIRDASSRLVSSSAQIGFADDRGTIQ